MNKICTTIEQSKKLMELGVDRKSSDMYYPNRIGMDNYALSLEWKHGNKLLAQEIPAWSLSALLDIMPFCILNSPSSLCLEYGCNCVKYELETYADNPIDACYEMINKLNELKLL